MAQLGRVRVLSFLTATGCTTTDCFGNPDGARGDIDLPTPAAGSTITTAFDPEALDSASAWSQARVKFPASTITPFSIVLDCDTSVVADFVDQESRTALSNQTLWVHLTIDDPSGATYSIASTGPAGLLTGGGQRDAGGVPFETTYGLSRFVLASDPDGNGIPPAGQEGYGLFAAVPPTAAFRQVHAIPNPLSRGSGFPVAATEQAGAASGTLATGEYTIGLGCYPSASSDGRAGATYSGSISYQAAYTVTISSAGP